MLYMLVDPDLVDIVDISLDLIFVMSWEKYNL